MISRPPAFRTTIPLLPMARKTFHQEQKPAKMLPMDQYFFHQAHPPTLKTTSALPRRPHKRFRHLSALSDDAKTTSSPSHRLQVRPPPLWPQRNGSRETVRKTVAAPGRVDPAEKVRYCLRKPLVARDHEREGPTACCGRGGGRQAGGFPEAVPYFFSRIHIRCGRFQFFAPLPAECSCRPKCTAGSLTKP